MELVDILLSTYNAEGYLDELLNSLMAQVHQNWKLIVRDDGSSDTTVAILNRYARFDHRICLVDTQKRQNLGALKSFNRLMKFSTAAYIMFCDQDDVWLPNKIVLSMQTMRGIEADSPNHPVLVHTDLKVVDERCQVISDSFWNYQGLQPQNKLFNQLVVQNNVTGCTVMVNRSLIKCVDDIPSGAIMHDWWIALVAASHGKIGVIYSPTILYRQHGRNEVGAKAYSLTHFLSRAAAFRGVIRSIRDLHVQVRAFRDKYSSTMDANTFAICERVDSVLSAPKWKRWARIGQLTSIGAKKQGTIRQWGFILALIIVY